MVARATSPGRSGRAANYVNALLTLVVLLVIVPLALRASHEPPPAIAEFAPQVQQQIKQAPTNQSSQFGHGSGGEANGLGGQPSPTPPPVQVPENLLKHCVGDPPRQIEDAQSPPCVAYWQGNNGGHTSQGVDKYTITLGEPVDCDKPGSGQGESYLEYDDLVNFFNKRFEFYGRRIVPYCLQTSNGSAQENTEEQDADNMAAHQPFASTMYRSGGGRYYNPRVSCVHHVISVTYYLISLTKKERDQCPGYEYEYVMGFEEIEQNLGQWTCSRLVPGKAVHSRGNDVAGRPMQGDPRKFGIIFQPFYNDEPGTMQPLIDELKLCGVNVPVRDALNDPVVDPTNSAVPEDPSQSNSAMLQLKNDGVTSILCMCNFYTYGAFTRSADSENYFPEWLVTTYGGLDWLYAQDLAGANTDQLQDSFGLTFRPRAIPPAEEPYYQAMREVDQANTPKGPDSIDVTVDQEVYHNMLMLMSGIQMAGPDLTPQTFGQGLASGVFPNPDTPLHEGHVGFAGYTYSMTIDGAEWWYGLNQASPYPDTSGAWAICYVNDGQRYTAGHWPKGGDPFFNGPCHGVT